MKAVVLTQTRIDYINNMFCAYSEDPKAKITFRDMLAIDGMVMARVECSGSEGWYVEVARWNDEKLTYQRLCFCKFFDIEEAQEIVDAINWHFRSEEIGLIHALENYGDNTMANKSVTAKPIRDNDESYKVKWEIDITAATPMEAARMCWGIQHDKDSTATVFTVESSDGSIFDADVAHGYSIKRVLPPLCHGENQCKQEARLCNSCSRSTRVVTDADHYVTDNKPHDAVEGEI